MSAAVATKEQREHWKAAGQRMNQRSRPVSKDQQRGLRIMFIVGLLLFVGGVAATVITFTVAKNSPTGGTYIIAFGPVIAGVSIMGRAASGRG